MESRTFTIGLPGGKTASLLRSLQDRTTSLSARIQWKGRDIVEFTSQDSFPPEKLLLMIKLVCPEAIIQERKQGREETIFEWPTGKWIEGVVACPNKNCVSAQPKEPTKPRFKIVSWNPVTLQCYYCGRYIDHASILDQLA